MRKNSASNSASFFGIPTTLNKLSSNSENNDRRNYYDQGLGSFMDKKQATRLAHSLKSGSISEKDLNLFIDEACACNQS